MVPVCWAVATAERNGWMGKSSFFKFQRKVSLGIAFESADLFGDHVPSCSVSSKDLGGSLHYIQAAAAAADVLEELEMIGAHAVEAACFH